MGTIPGGEPGRGYITGLGLAADIHFNYLDTASVTIHTSTAIGDTFGVWENGDTINLYYGGADSCVALATGSIRQLLRWLDEHGTAS